MVMQLENIKGILFDFDGVLAETMEDHFKAWKKALGDFGAELKPNDYFPWEGMALAELAKRFCRKNNLDTRRYQEIIEKKEQYYLQDHQFKLYPHAEAFIDCLKTKQLPIGIVSAGLYDRLLQSVPPTFLNKFNVIITGDKTKRGKPFPDPYLKGAEELKLDIKNCAVIENAPLGIKSAKKAGAYCIAICSTLDQGLLTGADEIVKEIKDCAALMGC